MVKGSHKLTLLEERFCWEYVFGKHFGNGSQTYLAVCPHVKKTTANTSAVKLLKRDIVRAKIAELKEESGMNIDFVMKKVREGFNANVVSVFQGEARETAIPNYSIRHKYAETAAKLLGAFPSQKVDSRSINIDVQIDKLPAGELAKLLGAASKKDVRSQTEINLLEEGKTKSLD